MKTYYIWLKSVDDNFLGEYEFYDTVYGTEDDLNEALKDWRSESNITVLGVTSK